VLLKGYLVVDEVLLGDCLPWKGSSQEFGVLRVRNGLLGRPLPLFYLEESL
jgi:hypothetical protein